MSSGEQRWNFHGLCGRNIPLPDGSPTECDPDGDTPCCGAEGGCHNDVAQCSCQTCVDYRTVRDIRQSGEECSVADAGGFLVNACFEEETYLLTYKCFFSSDKYEYVIHENGESFVTNLCEDDPKFYQVCGRLSSRITDRTDSAVLCGGYLCDDKDGGIKLTKCIEERCEDVKLKDRQCPTSTENNEDISYCDNKCDMYGCEDESGCRGYNYGVNCTSDGRNRYVPPEFLCDGSRQCDSDKDETGCSISNGEPGTCIHSKLSKIMNVNKTVPILNSTRCSVLGLYPYCEGYLEQTNCSDVERIAGQCSVNGFRTTISNYVMCDFGEEQLPGPINLCDDGLESACVEPSSSSGCKIHKHKMCNGEVDCPDGSDEVHDSCSLMTGKFHCERLFYSKTKGLMQFPISWILDNVTDCKNGEDEKMDSDAWKICLEKNYGQKLVKLQEETCSNVFYCPGNSLKSKFIEFQNLCDGVESCGTHGGENNICNLARDFPVLTTRGKSQKSVLDLCSLISLECSIKQFRRKFGKVLGVLNSAEMELKVPTNKVDCSMMFGEYYVYLSCLGLCLDQDAICPLNDKPLRHNSCPNQFPDRVYTLANNSYLTFALKSQTDHTYYQPNLFQCSNSKCIEIQHVCNLVDDCGDFSDEANCNNHAVCQDNGGHLISFTQVCDGIYDCFDLSDECNELCGREILGHWTLKCICWIMGILAVIFNALTVFKGVLSLSELRNKTTSLFVLFNKSLVTLIGSGDFLIGVYLITLSIYDSIVFGWDYCKFQAEWLTGKTCSVLGVLSTVGSQVSLFAMTVLSVIRVVGVFKRTLTLPRKLDKYAIILASLILFSIAAISLAVAVLGGGPTRFFRFFRSRFRKNQLSYRENRETVFRQYLPP